MQSVITDEPLAWCCGNRSPAGCGTWPESGPLAQAWAPYRGACDGPSQLSRRSAVTITSPSCGHLAAAGGPHVADINTRRGCIQGH